MKSKIYKIMGIAEFVLAAAAALLAATHDSSIAYVLAAVFVLKGIVYLIVARP